MEPQTKSCIIFWYGNTEKWLFIALLNSIHPDHPRSPTMDFFKDFQSCLSVSSWNVSILSIFYFSSFYWHFTHAAVLLSCFKSNKLKPSVLLYLCVCDCMICICFISNMIETSLTVEIQHSTHVTHERKHLKVKDYKWAQTFSTVWRMSTGHSWAMNRRIWNFYCVYVVHKTLNSVFVLHPLNMKDHEHNVSCFHSLSLFLVF